MHSQSSEFFIATIFFVLASSSLSWTGPNSFSILGYSLGGGIAVNFASCFPSLISSVILLAPSGLIRPYHFGWRSRLLHSSRLLPDWAVEQLVYWKLSSSSGQDQRQSGTAIEDELPLVEQCGDEPARGPKFDIPMALEWQVQRHKGFVKSNISSLRHAPISGQHHQWIRMTNALSNRDTKVNQQATTSHASQGATVLIMCGENDPVIIAKELETDSKEFLGRIENSVFVITPGAGHGFPITHSKEVVETITKFWEHQSHQIEARSQQVPD
ncbi:hypothetical protein XANCAGTX0491_000205 [Xanthoria calcicola]